jgi:SAM-dependent methyltransferase/uncharacterized protein YbaR (Trm112 family)
VDDQVALDWDRWLTALGCPHCQGALTRSDAEGLTCDRCGVTYDSQEAVPAFLSTVECDVFDRFASEYRLARLCEGWEPVSADQALLLPFTAPPGHPRLYWQIRRQTFRRLARLLDREAPPVQSGPIADLGAGTGWLSYRLAKLGYRVLALDASLDKAFGLGAAAPYKKAQPERLFLARGDLSTPPLQEGRWSMVIFNASLHYARNLDCTVRRAACALEPGGRIVVLDTPISRQPVPGTGSGDRHLGCQEILAAFESAGLCLNVLHVWRGPRWWVHRLKSWMRGDATFSFPFVVGQRPKP